MNIFNSSFQRYEHFQHFQQLKKCFEELCFVFFQQEGLPAHLHRNADPSRRTRRDLHCDADALAALLKSLGFCARAIYRKQTSRFK